MKLLIQTLLMLSLCFGAGLLAAQESASVETATLSSIAIYPQRSAPARVISLNASNIAAEIPARIVSIDVRVGDIVEKDQVLVELRCIDYKLEQAGAEARVKSFDSRIELAQRRLERTRKLTMKQSVSEELLDERESALAVLLSDRVAATASLNLTRARVANCSIKSPFPALVTERTSAVGNYAEVGRTLVKILDIEQLEISAQVYALDIGQLESARQLSFEHDDSSYPVELRSILPSINAETRNREVRLLFQNGSALTGASGKLVWKEQRPHIPGNLIVRRHGELGVFIYENGNARFNVLPSAQSGRASPLDLPLSTIIITEGHYSLNDNDSVVAR